MTTTTAGKKERVKLVTPEFRVSFPAVFAAKKVNETDLKAKFSVQMLFRIGPDKDGKIPEGEKVVDITQLKAAVKNCIIEKFGADQSKWPQKVVGTSPEGKPIMGLALRLPFRSGVEKDYAGYGEGVIFVSASSLMKPGLVSTQAGPDGKPLPILDANEFYGGCYARATINAYYYKVKGNEGIAFGLQNIQKIRDGEPFSGRTKAEDDFDAIEAPAGASAAAPADLGI